MSMPNIPDITPEIKLCREDIIDMLLASIALEELGLSHIINAEGEKIQAFMKYSNECDMIENLLKVNDSVRKTLEKVEGIENLLFSKLNIINEILENNKCKNRNYC